jgi:hypothetical protein
MNDKVWAMNVKGRENGGRTAGGVCPHEAVTCVQHFFYRVHI